VAELPTLQQIRDLADRMRNDPRLPYKSEEDAAESIVAAMIHGGGAPPLLVFKALKEHWPEAAALVHIPKLDLQREHIFGLNHRPLVVSIIERLKLEAHADTELDAEELARAVAAIDGLLVEWDSVKFPNQVPAPIRDRALDWLRRRGLLIEGPP